MSLINELNKILDEDPDTYGYSQERYMHKTGFDNFDYLNGQIITTDDGLEMLNLGVDAGKIITVIGKSGTGKSTLAIQIGANIIEKYENSTMYILDFEGSNEYERIKSVTGFNDQTMRDKIQIKKNGLYSNTVYQTVVQIAKFKKANEKKLLVDHADGVLDRNGKVVKVMPPTIVMCDSIPMMMPRPDKEIDDLKGNMDATLAARVNTQLFKRLIQPCLDANIICIFINHITDDVQTGMMPKAASINYLKMGESLPGGKAAQYLTNTLIKLTASTKLEEDKSYQIKGFEIKAELVKSRTAAAGRTTTLIFNQLEGFDNELSILNYIKLAGKLKGSGVAYRLEGLDDITFRMSNFKEKLEVEPKLKERFYELGREVLKTSIRQSSRIRIENEEEITEVIDEEISSDFSDSETNDK